MNKRLIIACADGYIDHVTLSDDEIIAWCGENAWLYKEFYFFKDTAQKNDDLWRWRENGGFNNLREFVKAIGVKWRFVRCASCGAKIYENSRFVGVLGNRVCCLKDKCVQPGYQAGIAPMLTTSYYPWLNWIEDPEDE